MKRQEVLNEIEQAFEEVRKMINESHDHNQFNILSFAPKFKSWYAKKMDEVQIRS